MLFRSDRIIALNEFLFDDLGFGGNTDNYYDPRNSYLNEVIDRRTGIPITLSVLYMEIGRRIELPFEGVSFPGHFLVRLPLRGGTLVLDPISGGVPQPEAELRERLKRVIPREALVDEAAVAQFGGRFRRHDNHPVEHREQALWLVLLPVNALQVAQQAREYLPVAGGLEELVQRQVGHRNAARLARPGHARDHALEALA